MPISRSKFLKTNRRRTYAEFIVCRKSNTVCASCGAGPINCRIFKLNYIDPHPNNSAGWCFGYVHQTPTYEDEPI